jgi:very-short-patch-repair endonuclease
MRSTHLGAAKAREKSGQVLMSPEEHIIFGALSVGPCAWVRQRAVDVYNIDISMQELPVAIEIEGGSAFASRRKASAFQRIKHLTNQGWVILYVVLGRGGLDVATVTKKIYTLTEIARSDKSVFGKYGVIDGHGNPRTSARYKPDGVPRIAGF